MLKTIAFVPIRLNNERLPNKNIKLLGDKPLCVYIFESLLACKIDEVHCYCSDEKIKDYLPNGVIFTKRNKTLDQNTTKGLEIYHAFAKDVPSDIYILAHATSPFLTTEKILQGLKQVVNGINDSAFTARKFQTFAWYGGKPINYELNNIPRTQDIQPIWMETSGAYIFLSDILEKMNRRIGINPYIIEVGEMDGKDIDYQEDFEFAEIFLPLLSKAKNQ